MTAQTSTYRGNLRKVQWLRSFSATGKAGGRRRFGIFKRPCIQWVRYKQGEIILVEVLGDRYFRDPKKDVTFHVGAADEIRLLPDSQEE